MKRKFTSLKKTKNHIFCGLMFIGSLSLFAQTNHDVAVTNNVFTPDEITITVGDQVTWTNTQGNHNVNGTQATYPSNPESFGNNVGSGWTYSYVFETPGVYDYVCDPHAGFGMVGKVIVEEAELYNLTINFSGMTPHVGQNLWIRLENDDTNDEIYRSTHVIETNFSLVIPGIEAGQDYIVQFFADHNSNGRYDTPSGDHAWELELLEVDGDEVLDFSHNTNFKDIEWEHRAILNLSNMTPHVGQEIYFALIETISGEIIERKSEVVSQSFSVELGEIMAGKDYRIDFFADHNGNGYYDVPSTDHAWRLELPSVNGDDTLNFSHNTNFTDIEWMHRLRVNFSAMNPHIGQKLTLYVRDQSSGETIQEIVMEEITDADFKLEAYGILPGSSYNIDFYADLNGNGQYDAPPTDHAWRLLLSNVMGDEELDFSHNTSFTDIENSGTTLVENGLEQYGISLYPNPASDFAVVKSTYGLKSVIIRSVTGANLGVIDAYGNHELILPLENLDSGIYFLEVLTVNDNRNLLRILRK